MGHGQIYLDVCAERWLHGAMVSDLEAGDSTALVLRMTLYTRVQRAQILGVTRGGKQLRVPRVGLLDCLDDKSVSCPREHGR